MLPLQYWCLCLQLVNKFKMEWIIVFMRNLEPPLWREGMFCNGELQSSVRISHGDKNFCFCCCATPAIKHWRPCLQRRELSVQMNYFVRENLELVIWKKRTIFGSASSKVFTVVLWESTWRKDFVLISCSFKAYCKLHRPAFTWLDVIMDIRVSGWRKIVLVSKSNLSLATGLASWKVNLESCWVCLYLKYRDISTKLY